MNEKDRSTHFGDTPQWHQGCIHSAGIVLLGDRPELCQGVEYHEIEAVFFHILLDLADEAEPAIERRPGGERLKIEADVIDQSERIPSPYPMPFTFFRNVKDFARLQRFAQKHRAFRRCFQKVGEKRCLSAFPECGKQYD